MAYSTELLCFSYSCSSQSEEFRNNLKYSNKILLSPTVLNELNKNDDIEFPLFFKITNKETEYGKVCGVQEFTAPPGVCNVPYYIMEELGIQEGTNVHISLVNPNKGTYIKLRPPFN